MPRSLKGHAPKRNPDWPRARVLICDAVTLGHPAVRPERSDPLWDDAAVLRLLAIWKRSCPDHHRHAVRWVWVRSDGRTVLIPDEERAA